MKQVKIEIYTPEICLEDLILHLSKIGACKIGQYSYVSSYAKVSGTWMPEVGSAPYQGEIGKLCRGEEYKLEVRCPYEKVKEALKVIYEHHPYEEPAMNIVPLLNDAFDLH